jgi:choline dehydrogenase-like flavoprotein
MIIEGREIRGPVREAADIIVIGSGCGGGATAKILAESGRKVIVLEEGGYYTPDQFVQTEEGAYTNLYQRRGGQATDDLGVTVLQGRCVGGSSTVNWTTSLRTPDFVLEAWRTDHGVTGLSPRDLEPYFDRIERYLNVHAEAEVDHSPNNRIILDGSRALGWRSRASGRNTRGCVKAGACGLGCPFDAKLSVDRTYIPDAGKAGATVFADCRALSIAVSRTAKRVDAAILDRESRKPRLSASFEAPVVVVSGSAIHSPVVLLSSGLANSSGEMGKNLTFHLTTAVMGLFDRPINPFSGMPQSALCDEFLNRSGDGGGFWIESVPVYPALAALALPGFGRSHRSMMRNFPYIGASIALVKEIDSAGRVTVNDYGRPVISYRQGARDLAYLKEAIEAMVRLHFAAGARSVRTLHTRPLEFTAPEGIRESLERASWEENDLALYSAHPLGTCRMGGDPRRSVVDSHCQSHDVGGLFIIDGSVTPTSLGVNPQLTILAIAEKSAEWIADHYRTLGI